MTEYSWPWENYQDRAATARAAWPATVRSLPIGTRITGEVLGRQRFGVFLSIDGYPNAVCLAEITAMPRGANLDLPQVGERVSGEVIWHAEHNHQVKIKLTEWALWEDLLPQLANSIGQIISGRVTRLTPIGAFVRIADGIEGLLDVAELPGDPEQAIRDGDEITVRIIAFDLERRRITLSAVAQIS